MVAGKRLPAKVAFSGPSELHPEIPEAANMVRMPPFSLISGPAILLLACLAFTFVFAEERLDLRKSKPVMVAAGLIWILVAIDYHLNGQDADIGIRVRHILVEYSELFLFLLSATSFAKAMVERNLFEALRSKLTRMQLSSRGLYWLTGAIAFALSLGADSLTTSLVITGPDRPAPAMEMGDECAKHL